jgi:putative endopeptidase
MEKIMMTSKIWLAGMALAASTMFSAPVRAQETGGGLPEVDSTANPCSNFYKYACGPWMKAHPIPADQAAWGSFSILQQNNQTILKDALDKVAANPQPDSQRIGDFYASCMAEDVADSKGAAPLKPLLDKIAALKDKRDLARLVAELHDDGVNVLFGFGSQTDFQDARQDIATVAQAGLGLPNRDFYLRDSDKDKQTRAAYVAHIAHIFQLLGDDEGRAGAKAQAVMRIESALAKGSLSLSDLNNPHLTNHKKPAADLGKLAPAFVWADYFAALDAPKFPTLNIAEPDFVKVVQQQIADNSLDDIKTYLAWHAAHSFAPWLSKAFVDENFAFYGKTLSGAQEIRPRWKRCVQLTDSMLGEDLGQYFVKVAFGPDHKARMQVLVKNLQSALDEDIGTLAWMGPVTKQRAHEKLAAIVNKIGYPEHWRDYSSLTIVAGDLVGNVERATHFADRRDVAKIGKPHDKMEWGMTPPTVNAYYDPSENDINFPAGILQPPFFNIAADDAVNYGAIGMVIGHEITHGFDDQGRQYDKDGNLKDWWSKEDAKKFEARAQCVVDQYGSYTAIDDVKQNGRATLGENLADNGGLRIALAALRKAQAGKPDQKIGGFTADQRFFLGFAQVWCGNVRDEAKRMQALSDVHSLAEFRVNGTISNNEEFAKAFNCKPDDAMVRGVKACRVW